MPDVDDPDQEATDHGNLIDLGVAEVEREAAEASEGQDLAGMAAEPLPPIDRPTGAAAFSEAQVAEEDSELQETRNGPSEPTEADNGNDEQAAELRAEKKAEAQDSVT